MDYLPEEQGGRAKEGQKPPKVKANADGALASRVKLEIRLTEKTESEQPSDAEKKKSDVP